MNIPCEQCATDAPEEISSMLMPKTELFSKGWHVHRSTDQLDDTAFKNNKKTQFRTDYFVFLDDEQYDKTIKLLMDQLYNE